MTKLVGETLLPIPGWVNGLEKATPPAVNEPGTLADGQNLVALPSGKLATRGGSRTMLTLHNDGAGAEVTGLNGIWPWTSIGGLVVGYDTTTHKCYAWYLTQNAALAGANEAQSRVDLSLTPTPTIVSAPWTDVGGAPFPQVAEVFENLYLADATVSQATRRWFLQLDQTLPVVQIGSPTPNIKVPRFCFAGTGSGATAHANLSGTSVNTITVDTGGSGYTTVPTVVLTGGGGSGALAHAVLTAGVVTSIVVDAGGTGYTPAPTVTLLAGQAQEITPYCLEPYNNVLFVAGYGDESAGNADRPEYLRHSFLGQNPSNSLALGDVADGFDKDAWNIIGAVGQRITAMKQGAGVLLVAKANELYRVSGAGRAYPGWQYAVERVQNTSGMGCSNPNCLTFAEGYWYGLGAAGPFRTNGFSVETLVGPRRPDFDAVDLLANAWCAYHPDRRMILFATHPQGTSPSLPWDLWLWDVQRERWQPDWVFAIPTAFSLGNNIPTTSVQGPTAPPSNPTTTAVTTSGYTANWTNGDALAQTEVWQLDALTLTWDLLATVNPGVATFPVTTDIDHLSYQWKVRHVRNGLRSAYTTPQVVMTLIAPPVLSYVFDNGSGNWFVNALIVSHGTPVTLTVFATIAPGSPFVQPNCTFGQNFNIFPNSSTPPFGPFDGFVTDMGWTPQNSTTTVLP
ncbi:MAG TPA: hypothetical protein VJS20_04565 [Gemmatimonadales bacterium]|nr:hypothetical protein [Gemmatimonadales bacterium]